MKLSITIKCQCQCYQNIQCHLILPNYNTLPKQGQDGLAVSRISIYEGIVLFDKLLIIVLIKFTSLTTTQCQN